jgi:hypothetical protein
MRNRKGKTGKTNAPTTPPVSPGVTPREAFAVSRPKRRARKAIAHYQNGADSCACGAIWPCHLASSTADDEHLRGAHNAFLDRDIKILEDTLQLCVRRRDWRGVISAASDIRVLEAEKIS